MKNRISVCGIGVRERNALSAQEAGRFFTTSNFPAGAVEQGLQPDNGLYCIDRDLVGAGLEVAVNDAAKVRAMRTKNLQRGAGRGDRRVK